MEKNVTLYYGAVVHTMDPAYPTAEAFAVADGMFIAVGSRVTLERAFPYAQRCSLDGCIVLPGLIDSHLHILHTGDSLIGLKIKDKSKQAVLDEVARACASAAPGQWITGMGWDETKWDDSSLPTRWELDCVSGNVPVSLARYCGHAAWVNSAALTAAGITDDITDPVGGEFLRDSAGRLTGIAVDNAQMRLSAAARNASEALWTAQTIAADHLFRQKGLTSVQDMGAEPATIDLWGRLYDEGQLKTRIYTAAKLPGRPEFQEILSFTEKYCGKGIRRGLHNGRLTARSVKYFLDGSLGAHSAWLLDDYADRPGHRGCGRFTDKELEQLCRVAAAKDFQVICHAIGDGAVHQCLDVYERVLSGDIHRRWRVEHSQILQADDLGRFRRLGVIPTCQTVFAADDMYMAEDRLGSAAGRWIYPWQTLAAANPLPNGSDSPVSDLTPFAGMYCAITGGDYRHTEAEGWNTKETLTREQALASYTVWPARAAFEENVKGSITPGKYADFVVVDRDPLCCDVESLPQTEVLLTVIGGEIVWQEGRTPL